MIGTLNKSNHQADGASRGNLGKSVIWVVFYVTIFLVGIKVSNIICIIFNNVSQYSYMSQTDEHVKASRCKYV